MEKLNFRNIEKHISDAIIYDMASNYCVPALYEYLRRIRSRINSQHTSKYKKMFRDIKRLHANFSKTHKKFISLNHLLSLSSKEITIEAKKLTLITPKLYDAPVRALVSPVNSDYIDYILGDVGNNSYEGTDMDIGFDELSDDSDWFMD